MIIDYATLQTEIASWISREDLTDTIPTFIQLNEADLSRNLRVPDMEVRASPLASSGAISLPSDCRSVKSLKNVVTTTSYMPALEYVGPEEFENFKVAQITGQPVRYYTIIGNYVPMLPAPQDGTAFNLSYWQTIPALSDTNTSNWLLVKSPELYLYGSILQAVVFGFEDERVPLLQAAKQKIMDDMDLEGSRYSRPQTQLTAQRRAF